MAKDTFSFMDAEAKLPIEDTASEYYVYTDKNGKSTAILPQDLTDAQMKAFADSDEDYPTFSVYNGKVSVTGSGNYLNSDIVDSVSKTLQDYYKGVDLANEQVAENFQKTLDEVNAQVKSQLQYQDYMDFLDKTGFSDDAYRNYALAVQETDPKTTTNIMKSKKKFIGLKKDGTLTTKDEAMTPEEWIGYWKANYNPEERAQLWMDSAEALARASNGDGNDNDLYAALPYLIMGHSEGVNFPAGAINTLNPFDESGLDVSKDWENAKVSTPLYGFEDTNDLSVFTQAFIRQLGMRGLEIASDVLTFDNPWSELGATNGAQYFGIDDWDDSDLQKMSREDYQDYASMAREAVKEGYDTYDKMKDEYGEVLAKKLWVVYSFSKTDPRAVGGGRVLDTIRNENGDVVAEEGDYPGYKTYQDFQSRLSEWRENRGGFESWKDENVDAMNKYVNQMAVYSPGFATAGTVAGQIASFVAEQAALSALTGGALSASNVAATLANAGWKLGANAINYTKIGQRIAAKVPALANALNAMATSTAATAAGLKQGYKIGKATLAASDATKAAQAIYTLGSIGNWAIREVGEDALRGLVDDAVMKNSFDSQGNLDVNKLIENVYMNAVMYGAAKGVGKALGGIGSLVNLAGTKSIDGVELNTTQRYQLNLFQKALDDQNSRIQFRGWNEDGHPVITTYGRTKILDQLAPSGETAKAVEDITGTAAPTAARSIENIINDENVPDDIKQKITETVDESKIDTSDPKWKEDIQTRLQEKLSDDEIRQAFPDGTIKVGDDTIKVDTKEFTSGDVNRVSGKEFATMDDAIEGLRTARKTSDFARSINGILRQSIDFAKNFKNAVQDFADANNMTVKDVMVEIRNSRLAGEETIPGLKDLWYENWKPIQDKLLDLQEQLTGIRPISHDFYFRDMLEGTFNPSASGAYSINNSSVIDMLGGDADFDLSASSTARNTGKLADIASDKLEYDPEVLAREFVASRMQTIWQSDDMGKIFATMQDAHEAGEYNFTEAQAAKSVGATERVSREVENSDGVKEIQNLANVSELGDEFAEVKVGDTPESTIKDIDAKIKAEKDNIKTIKEETTYKWEEDGKTVKKTLDDNIKDTEKQLAEQQAEVDSFAPKTDASEVTKMDYKTRNDLAKSYADKHPEYIVAYRRQPKGVDKWYSNGTGTRAGDLDDFSSYGSDKGDLTDAVWLTTDEKWASSKSKASAGHYNGEPDQTVVVLLPKSLIADGGGEQPLAPKGEGEFTDSWGNDRYTIRGFSEANEGKIVQTRGTESEGWYKAREANEAAGRTPVTDAMRYRLNPDFYEKTELVLFRDTQPDVIENSNKLILEEYNSKHKVENEFFAKKAQRSVDETQSVLDGLLAQKQKLDDAEANLKNLQEMKKKLQNTKTVEEAEQVIDEEELKRAAEVDKKTMVNAQNTFNKSAKKSNAAELISKNSGYSMRGQRVNPSAKPIGVNYMPGNPFGKWGSAVNDNYIKGNSIEMEFTAYKADGTPFVRKITAYNGGYKMYAEAGSFARNVIVDVRNGASLWDAIYKQVYDNGFFIEPSNNQRAKYGALTIKEQAAKVTDKFMDKMLNDKRFAHVFNDDGTVKSTDGLTAMLTTRFRSQGISDFTKFLRKSNFDSFTKGEQKWLNSRMYEMTASVNKNTFKKIVNWLIQGSMALRYKSTMGWNLKNGQLQLTECQRTFTANKIGDFGSTLKRLATDKDFRANVSDRTYILAADSAGAGFSKQELDMIADTFTKLGSESVINEYGIVTNIDKIKAKYKDFNDSLLASPQGGEYAKNYIMIAGFTAAGERAGLSGAELDSYVRNRFNVEALAGTQLGKIGLTDSRIGQFTFMYLGFPIRELTLQAHLIKGGGTVGGKGFKKALGSLDYIAKMLGAKGAMWAMEAPWGYTLLDQVGLDPFGVIGQYDPIQTDWEDREPGWRWGDLAVQYNPFLQGAMTSVVSDIYMAYRAAEEEARAEYREEHNGSTEGFEWSMFEDGADSLEGILKGLSPVGEQALGFIPGRTFYQRIEGELQDAQRGYHISQSGNRLYEANTDPGNILWGMIAGRRNTTNAQDYYQTANPIRGAIEGGWGGLGQQMERGFGSLNPFRSFREFDPIDSDTYTDWFNGSYADQQNWNTGVYAFREEAQQIKDKYDKYISEGKEINSQNARENELADLRNRVEKFVKAYTDKHPEGISYSKQNQLINILNLGDYQSSLDEAVEEASGNVDYSDWDAAQNRYMQGNFPTPYGLRQTKEGENVYGQSPQLQQILSQQRYGIASDVAPTIKQMYNSQKFDTPLGNMTMKDYHDRVYAQLQDEWNKGKTDYDKVTKIQEEYLAQISKNVIQPILNTYGSSVLSAGKSSDIMQEFGKMLYSMVPSDDYRIDNKGKKIYKSTPYMTIDIPKWLNKNFKAYSSSVNTTNQKTKDRLESIRSSIDQGHASTAISKAKALVDDIGKGKASVSREELEWLQGVLND